MTSTLMFDALSAVKYTTSAAAVAVVLAVTDAAVDDDVDDDDDVAVASGAVFGRQLVYDVRCRFVF